MNISVKGLLNKEGVDAEKRLTKKQKKIIDDFIENATEEQIDNFCSELIKKLEQSNK